MDKGYVPVIHAGRDDRPDELDTVHAAGIVAATLSSLGYRSDIFRVGLDFGVLNEIAGRKPKCVFNLVDALEGNDALIGLVPSFLEHLGLPFTGCGSEAFNLTRSKSRTKGMMRQLGVPTADWSEDGAGCLPSARYIVKSDTLHGSQGIDENSVVSGARVRHEIAERAMRYGGRFFCEKFIEGREFNVALVEDLDAVRVLPIQEIDFAGFPDNRNRIVDFAAKWNDEDVAYHTTNRRFGIEKENPAFARHLTEISKTVWREFSLRGYARIDFRVDDGNPYVLEINANPAISPDAGFAAAAGEAGISYAALLEELLGLACGQIQRSESASSNIVTIPTGDQVGMEAGRPAIVWRRDVTPSDAAEIASLVRATGYFTSDEAQIASELVSERLAKGAASGYEFIIAEQAGRIAGYACFGKIDGTEAAFDLYWIAVDPALQGRGLGREILRRAEGCMQAMGATHVYVDTSSSETYNATRAFYTAMGYDEKARLDDFYRNGDGKVIFVSNLRAAAVGV